MKKGLGEILQVLCLAMHCRVHGVKRDKSMIRLSVILQCKPKNQYVSQHVMFLNFNARKDFDCSLSFAGRETLHQLMLKALPVWKI